MPLPPLPDSAITVGAHASDWREAVELAGEALARSGATEPGYAARMIQVIDEFGAYIVIAPGWRWRTRGPGRTCWPTGSRWSRSTSRSSSGTRTTIRSAW